MKTFALSLVPQASVHAAETFKIKAIDIQLDLGSPGRGQQAALAALARSAVDPEALAALAQEDGFIGQALLSASLQTLDQQGLLQRTLMGSNGPLATLRPKSGYFRFNPDPPREPDGGLSRFAAAGIEDGVTVWSSPLAHAELHLHHPKAAELIWHLARGKALPADLLPQAEISDFMILAGNAGLWPVQEEPAYLAMWEPHDLAFHVRTRLGRHRQPYGDRYPFEERFPPPPMIKPETQRDFLALPAADPLPDQPFAQVLATRRSRRDYGETAVDHRALGSLLYHCLNLRHQTTDRGMEVSQRPTPGGGAIHALEIYPAIHQCQGLNPGLYRYCPDRHGLFHYGEENSELQAILENYQPYIAGELQVVLLIAARFGRMSWKYRTISYATLLKDLGALYQSLYLVATAMNLAPCAIGNGNSQRFARLTGIPFFEEGTIGEFLLGSLPRP